MVEYIQETQPASDDEFDQLLTSTEVANKLRTTISALCHMRKHNRGPEYVRVGRRFKYPYKRLLEYLKNNCNF